MPSPPPVLFYLVGALTGLINRLRIESGRSSAVEDYGLFLSRLIAVPVLSGLTAIGGVYLVSKTPEFLGAITTGTPEPCRFIMALGYIMGQLCYALALY